MKLLFGMLLAVALVLAGSVLPWATLTGTGRLRADYLAGDLRPMEVTVNAWSSHVRYGAIAIPNAFVLMFAVGAALAGCASAAGKGETVSFLASGLALCGLVHSLCFLVILVKMQSGSIGVGAVIAAGGMLMLLLLTPLARRAGQRKRSE
jgi:hypothetical protein